MFVTPILVYWIMENEENRPVDTSDVSSAGTKDAYPVTCDSVEGELNSLSALGMRRS